MATKYDDIYIRSTLNDPQVIPRQTAGISSSPDIIPYGPQPVEKPKQFFTGNYNSDVGKALISGTPNYIYQRAINLFNGARDGAFSLYYVPSSVLLYPAQWRNNKLRTSGGKDEVPVKAAATNEIVVTEDPFEWIPPQPPSNFHYCLIGRMSTSGHPNPIPDVGAMPDFAAWVAQNGGIGWRNVTITTAGAPTFTGNSHYPQGEIGETVNVQLDCTDLPKGSKVWFSSGTPLPDGKTISLPVTTISEANSRYGFSSIQYVPPGFETTITWSYDANGGTPGQNFSITLNIFYLPPATSKLFSLTQTAYDHGIQEHMIYDQADRRYKDPSEFVRSRSLFRDGPIRGILLGRDAMRHAKT